MPTTGQECGHRFVGSNWKFRVTTLCMGRTKPWIGTCLVISYHYKHQTETWNNPDVNLKRREREASWLVCSFLFLCSRLSFVFVWNDEGTCCMNSNTRGSSVLCVVTGCCRLQTCSCFWSWDHQSPHPLHVSCSQAEDLPVQVWPASFMTRRQNQENTLILLRFSDLFFSVLDVTNADVRKQSDDELFK